MSEPLQQLLRKLAYNREARRTARLLQDLNLSMYIPLSQQGKEGLYPSVSAWVDGMVLISVTILVGN